MSNSKILFLMSGSIAAFKACQVISKLVHDGNEVQVVTTPALKEFIGNATLEGLTGTKVLSHIFDSNHAMDHIHLTRWADLALVCPASASTLARIASGFADDMVSAIALAWPQNKPMYLFPAMNSAMWDALPTQENLQKIRKRGFHVAETDQGLLACGETGWGRLLEPEKILQQIKILKSHSKYGESDPSLSCTKEILVTAGATREPIDGIRFISNVSTGKTGSELAKAFAKQGWSVTYMHGQGAFPADAPVRPIEFSSFSDLEEKLQCELAGRNFSAVIHCAAVSDYSLAEIRKNGQSLKPETQSKLPSDHNLELRLKLNPKLLPQLKGLSRNPHIKVVGFKLTLNATESETLSAAQKIWDERVDAIVANDWSQVTADRQKHPCRLLTRSCLPQAFTTVGELADALITFLDKE